MRRLLQFPVRHPWYVISGWIVLVVVAGTVGRLVPGPTSSPQNLPSTAPSVRAAQVEQRAFGISDSSQTAQILIVNPAGIAPADRQLAGAVSAWAEQQRGIASVSSPIVSPDQKALLINLTLSSAGDQVVANLEHHLAQLETADEVNVAITGEPVVGHDLTAAALGQDSSSAPNGLRLLTYLLILVILALVFRAPLAVATPMLAIWASLAVSLPLLPVFERLASIPASTFSEPFAIAVTIGAGTNYGIFLISRYRQEMARDPSPLNDLARALGQVGHAILFSAGSVIVATSLMAVAQLGILHSLGPAIAFSVAIMLLAGLTLMPALMALFGGRLFWPRRAPQTAGTERVWSGVAHIVVSRPAISVVVGVAVLAPLAVACLKLAPSFDTVRSLPGSLPSARGYALLADHFGSQLSSAGVVITGPADLNADPGVLSGAANALNSITGLEVAGPPAISADGQTALIRIVLSEPSASSEAMHEIGLIQTAVRAALGGSPAKGDQVLIAGSAAADADQRTLLGSDFLVIAILVAVAIYAIICLLLRDLLTPIYLLGSTGLSTLAAIGLIVLVHQATGEPVFWTTPVFAFVFLIALGQDFNILLITTIRREASNRGRIAGVRAAVASTGGIISSCGIVMAAAFLLLARSPVSIVQQIGLVVIVGLVLDTFLVRPVLVPGLVILFGARAGGRGSSVPQEARASG
jgi:RND superfamily putative drug exporter